MDAVAVTVGAAWTIVGLLCVALAVPLAQGRVRRNPFYGVRFPQSFRSDEAWLAINRFGGRRMILWSLPLIAVGVLSFFLPLRDRSGLALALAFAPLAFILIPLFETWRFARKYAARG